MCEAYVWSWQCGGHRSPPPPPPSPRWGDCIKLHMPVPRTQCQADSQTWSSRCIGSGSCQEAFLFLDATASLTEGTNSHWKRPDVLMFPQRDTAGSASLQPLENRLNLAESQRDGTRTRQNKLPWLPRYTEDGEWAKIWAKICMKYECISAKGITFYRQRGIEPKRFSFL